MSPLNNQDCSVGPSSPHASHVDSIWSPHQRCTAEEMISMIESLWGAYTAMSTRHLNTKASLYVSLLPSRPPSHPAFTFPAFQHSEESTSWAWLWGGTALNVLNWVPPPPFSRLGLADVHSSQRISEGEEAFFFVVVIISLKKNQKYDKTMFQDLLMFCFFVLLFFSYCEPKMLPHSSSICDFYHFWWYQR